MLLVQGLVLIQQHNGTEGERGYSDSWVALHAEGGADRRKKQDQ